MHAPQLSPAQGDYLLCIARLAGTDSSQRTVRLSEVAAGLGVSRASACTMVRRLAAGGWLTYARGQGARLRSRGLKRVLQFREAQSVLESLFFWLEVPASSVAQDAAGLKHCVSMATVRAIARLTTTLVRQH